MSWYFIKKKTTTKEEVKNTIKLKISKIKDAFDLLKISFRRNSTKAIGNNSSEKILTLNSFTKLMNLVDTKLSLNQISVLFQVLDFDNSQALSFKEFLYLPDLLNIRITEIKDRMNLLEQHMPNVYNHRYSVILRQIVKHWLAYFCKYKKFSKSLKNNERVSSSN